VAESRDVYVVGTLVFTTSLIGIIAARLVLHVFMSRITRLLLSDDGQEQFTNEQTLTAGRLAWFAIQARLLPSVDHDASVGLELEEDTSIETAMVANQGNAANLSDDIVPVTIGPASTLRELSRLERNLLEVINDQGPFNHDTWSTLSSIKLCFSPSLCRSREGDMVLGVVGFIV
jgi:hypothetical protein